MSAAEHLDATFVALSDPTRRKVIDLLRVEPRRAGELAAAFDIQSIPTLMILREKVILYSEAGALPANALEEIIGKAKAMDMEAVHAEVAKAHTEEQAGSSDPT